MKKLFFTALTAVTVISSAFAAPVKDVNNMIRQNFESSFKNVSDITWKVTSDFVKATFMYNNIRTEAFYLHGGEFIGTSYAITLDKLPTFAKRDFAKKYEGYTVKEAIEFDNDESVDYYISAVKDKTAVVLKITDGKLLKYNTAKN